MLVYKFIHRGNPTYFEPFLIPRHSTYTTRQSQPDGMFLEVPHFASVFKSQKHLASVLHMTHLLFGMTSLKSYLFEKAYPS